MVAEAGIEPAQTRCVGAPLYLAELFRITPKGHGLASVVLLRTAGLEPACLHTCLSLILSENRLPLFGIMLCNVPLIPLSYVRVIGSRPRIRTALFPVNSRTPSPRWLDGKADNGDDRRIVAVMVPECRSARHPPPLRGGASTKLASQAGGCGKDSNLHSA
jgi:hypothetical protein